MSQKRVFIVSQYQLFDAALQAALRQQPEVEVIGVCHDDLEVAYVQAQTLHPDVVLLIAGSDIIRPSALRLLEEVSDCLIQVNTTDGFMQVYRRQQVSQATLADLMRAIQVAKETLDEPE